MTNAIDARSTAPAEDRIPPELSEEAVCNIPTWRAAYSDRTCAIMALFSQLAYLPYETAEGKKDLVARLKKGGFELLATFDKKDTQGFLAMRDGQFAVLAFRGTTNLPDWLRNLDAVRVPLPERPGIMVHRGFHSAFSVCQKEITEALGRVPNDLGLYITGHSLGGALAQIASAAFERNNLAACYTYGSPRVGTETFDREVKCPHYRLVNNWDVVPGVPPPWSWGYHHTGDPRLLKPNKENLQTLRRDRGMVSRLIVDLLAVPAVIIWRRLFIVENHMIWNYRSQLDGISRVRMSLASAIAAADKGKST
jgi:triacylglycerol lipase